MGIAVGYYLGTMAGRERYEQLNRLLGQARTSDTFDTVERKARAVFDLGLERARDLVEARLGTRADAPALNGSEPDLILN